jgi:CRISPR-associated endonuclease/helicase Cas3
MNILLVSECDHRALTETRRILDQFAERRGERCWQTPITEAGLEALHGLLRKSARKNTAVACHWLRGKQPVLLWIVGDRSRFNAQGAAPVASTRRNVRRQDDESPMKDAHLLQLMVDLAGLLHDIGKALESFQKRLQSHAAIKEKNVIRHEWASLRLWQAFVGKSSDEEWLERLKNPSSADDASWHSRLLRDGIDAAPPSPLQALSRAPLAQAIGWLVLTHHRLPACPSNCGASSYLLKAQASNWLDALDPAWNERNFQTQAQTARSASDMENHWRWHANATPPYLHPGWRKRAARCADSLLKLHELPANPLADGYLMHSARLCLMLADHRYSSLEKPGPERLKLQGACTALWANRRRDKATPVCNQTLDEHLQGVARLGATLAHGLSHQLSALPALGRVPALAQRNRDPRYQWQDRAADLAQAWRSRTQQDGAFIVNMASTGCGKTLANARLMQALSDPERGMRCAFALGLRTLTLQTGRAFGQRLKLKPEQLAVLVGGNAQKALQEQQLDAAERTGSESRAELLDIPLNPEGGDALDRHPLLRAALPDERSRKMLQAPVLVCTIDHLTPATESTRGGHQILPMLRLMSGDLVLDEPDDFSPEDLPALGRLVHWAGLLGGRVLLSSATLTPHMVRGLFDAYARGRVQYRHQHPQPGEHAVPCIWLDEQDARAQAISDMKEFEPAHRAFTQQRAQFLGQQALAKPRRRFRLCSVAALQGDAQDTLPQLARLLLQELTQLHALHHQRCPRTGQAASFGLIRIANIRELVSLARALHQEGAPPGLRIHLCCYHAKHPLVVRSGIESVLDRVLQRSDPHALWRHPEVRERLDAEPTLAHCFVVLGSPVTEVGRDHSYDWAIVEPSSMRSIIQLAGRVCRHHGPPESAEPNIVLLSHNLRGLRPGNGVAFTRPGFESQDFRLSSHNLSDLLPPPATPGEAGVLDSRPRLQAAEPLQAKSQLADLEHARMRALFLESNSTDAPANQGWRYRSEAPAPHLTALLPQAFPFRKSQPMEDLVVQPAEAGGAERLERLTIERGKPSNHSLADGEWFRLDDAELPQDRGVRSWAVPELAEALALAPGRAQQPLKEKAIRYAVVSLPERGNGRWGYHPLLGLWHQS